MYLINQDLVRSQQAERMAQADQSARARRVASARRWTRRAEQASQRAARASSAVW